MARTILPLDGIAALLVFVCAAACWVVLASPSNPARSCLVAQRQWRCVALYKGAICWSSNIGAPKPDWLRENVCMSVHPVDRL